MIKTFLSIAIFSALTLPSFLKSSAAPSQAHFEAWVKRGKNLEKYRNFTAYLKQRGVLHVTEPWHLLRQGTDWKKNNLPGFAFPPRSKWKDIIPTLKLLDEEIIPVVGKVEIVSAFRTCTYNKASGGSRASRHMHFNAVDVVPVNFVFRSWLHKKLRAVHLDVGKSRKMGLGLYSGLRFHVDTFRFRSW